MTAPSEPLRDALKKALERAFTFGQNYWAEADSESYAANRRSAVTLSAYRGFVEETVSAISVLPSVVTSVQDSVHPDGKLLMPSGAGSSNTDT